MSNLVGELYNKLNIMEEYEVPEKEFNSKVIEKIIQQAAVGGFSFQPFEKALKAISPYMLQFGDDLKADKTKKESRDSSNANSLGTKDQSVSHRETESATESSGTSNREVAVDANVFGSTVSAKYNEAQTSVNNGRQSKKENQETVKELNKATQDSVKFELEGNRIKPKSLNVAKLSKMKFKTGFNINQIKNTLIMPLSIEHLIYIH